MAGDTPRLGAYVAGLDLPDSGLWIDSPHRVLFGGMFYFGLRGVVGRGGFENNWLKLDLRPAQNILHGVQNNSTAILPILRTDTQRELLIELFFETRAPRTLSDLARAIGVDQTTVMREVNRLLETGVVEETRVGRSRTVAINENSPFAAPLRQLVRVVYQPLDESEVRESLFSDRNSPHRTHHSRHDRRPLPSSRSRR